MDIKITEKKEEPLLSRTALKLNVSFKGATPSNQELKKAIASSLKSDEKLIAIRHIYTSFGIESADVIAYQYSNEKSMKLLEKEKKPKAKPGEEKAAEKAPPKEEVKAQAPKKG